MSGDLETRTITLPVGDGTSMPTYIARSPGAGKRPGLLVFQEIFGVNPHVRDITERFARAGYSAIAPAIFHRSDPDFESGYTDMSAGMAHAKALTDSGLTADITAAYQWLQSPEGGTCSKIAAIGYCLGGRVAFLANAVVSLNAAVSYYGGGIAPGTNSAGLLGRVGDLKAPMLFFWGGLDKHIDPPHVEAIAKAMTTGRKNHTQVFYSYADHGFFCDARAAYQPRAAVQSWALTLAFLQSWLEG